MTIDTFKLKVGDEFYGAIPKYSGPFLDGWKVRKCTVVKVTEYYFWITFTGRNNDPQKLKKRHDREELLGRTELEVREALSIHEMPLKRIQSAIEKKIKILRKKKSDE